MPSVDTFNEHSYYEKPFQRITSGWTTSPRSAWSCFIVGRNLVPTPLTPHTHAISPPSQTRKITSMSWICTCYLHETIPNSIQPWELSMELEMHTYLKFKHIFPMHCQKKWWRQRQQQQKQKTLITCLSCVNARPQEMATATATATTTKARNLNNLLILC